MHGHINMYMNIVLQMMDMYENDNKQLVIGPYSWTPWPDSANWAELPDPFIRQVS